MEIFTLLMIAVIAFLVIFFGRILSHSIKFVFFVLLILLAVVFIFGISLSEVFDFITGLIFAAF